MRRRDFLILLGFGAAGLTPVPLQAQRAARIPRLGVLLYSNPHADPNIEAFRRGLRELGYVDGQSIAIEYRYAEGRPERLPELAADLVRLNPDVVLALGGDVAPHAIAATATIPIVFGTSSDPVESGMVASLARPGGNSTGFTFLMDELASKRLALLKEAAPRVARVAVLFNPAHIDNELHQAQRAAEPLGVAVSPVEMRSPGDLDAALEAMTRTGMDALYVVSSRQTVASMARIVDLATRGRLPLAGGWGAWAQAGGLISYGPNVSDMLRQSATYVDKILKGAKPAELPVQQPTRFELLVNLKTAKALGLPISESFLLRADKVIE
jgi:putative ABC transport system substrate-binding protein